MTADHDFLEQVCAAVEAGVLLLATDGAVILANPAARDLLELSDDDAALPASGTFFSDPAGAPIQRDDLPWLRTARDGVVRRGHRLRLSDANELDRELVTTTVPLASAEGEPIGVVLNVRGTRAPDAYPAAEAGAVLAQMVAGVMVAGLDGSLRYANDALREIWGLEAPVKGEPEAVERFRALHHDGTSLPLAELPIGRALRGERVHGAALEIARGDESRGSVLVNAAPIRDPAGRVVAAAAVFVDITEREMADRLNEAIIAVATALDACLDPDEMLSRAVGAVGAALRADGVALLVPGGAGWRVAQSSGFQHTRPGAEMRPENVPAVERAFETGQPAAACDNRPAAARGAGHPDIGAFLAVPVRVRGQRAAVLVMSFRAPTAFTQAHLDFAQRLSQAISLALGNASLMTTMREELGHNRVLQEVAVVATSSPDLRVVCSRVLKALQRHLGLLTGDIRVISAEEEVLRLVAEIGLPRDMVERIREVAPHDASSIAAASMARGKPVTHEDEEAVRSSSRLMAGTHFDSLRYVVLPIDFRKRKVGTLSLAFQGKRPFTDDEMGLFEAIAHTLGQAIEGARLLDAEKRSRLQATAELEMTNLLLETAECLAQPLEMEQVLDALAGSVQRVTGRPRVIVMLFRPRTRELVVRAVRGVSPAVVGRARCLDGYPEPVRELECQDGALVVHMDEADAGVEGEGPAERRAQGLLVPIRYRDRLIGAVTADDPGGHRAYTQRELRLVEGVVSQAAVTIENARSYEDEHRIAETLQETLLLMPEHVPGVQFGTLYRSATAAARVGGDFYDVFEAGDNQVALIVGDVSGKGLDAASVTALARNAFRIHASEGQPPHVVMEKTNDVLRRFTSPETFVTAFFGVLDTTTGVFRYVCAGHPDGMVVGQGGYVRRLTGEAPLLGALEDVPFAEEVTMIAPNDTIFLYTDGVTEARQGLDFYGVSRLAEFLAGQRDNDPHHLPGAVFREVEAFAGGQLRDDVAMLAIRRMG